MSYVETEAIQELAEAELGATTGGFMKWLVDQGYTESVKPDDLAEDVQEDLWESYLEDLAAAREAGRTI